MLRFIFVIFLSLIMVSCQTRDADDFYGEITLNERIEKSEQESRRLERQAKSHTLLQKAEHFEMGILARMHPTYKLAARNFSSQKPSFIRTDMTAQFLSAMAYKYAVLQKEEDKRLIHQIVDTYFAVDQANGWDGFIPYKVRFADDVIRIVSNETHENVYVQLFHAYLNVLKHVDDKSLHTKIKEHSELILKHFSEHDFTLVNHLGEDVEYSDLSLTRFTILHNRQLSLMALIDYGLYVVSDMPLREKLLKTRKEALRLGYEDNIMDLHTEVFNLEFPTQSSSWLNMTKLYTGWHSSQDKLYKSALQKLHGRYADEQNVLFDLFEISLMGPEARSSLNNLRSILETFPLELAEREVISSREGEWGNYVKLKRRREAQSFIPVYERPLNNYLWKRNQLVLDENFKSTGNTKFPGIDFLQAYWLLRMLESKN